MSDQHPEMDPAATFRLDQEAAATEEANRHQIIWDHQVRDAETTMDQREAVTSLVRAKAGLLETLDMLIWMALIAAAIVGIGWALQVLIEAVR